MISQNYYNMSKQIAENIIIERGALSHVAEYLNLNRKVLVVTDDGVPSAYTDAVLSACKNGYKFVFEHGEESKSFDTLQAILKKMLDCGFTRTDAVVAVGGGVTGDMAGFAASCYMRGVDFYNIPTTLLAQVDSSIGGKTAINFGGVKNNIGAFYMPKKVIIDPETLRTLTPRLLHEGLAESIKMAATSDAELFSYIESDGTLDEKLDRIISDSLAIKNSVVKADPKEGGLRKVLNFGHTIGHAIEAASHALESNPEKQLYHGECVAIGMLSMASPAAAARIKAVLEKYDLPTVSPYSMETLKPYIKLDKKASGNIITTVYVNEIGKFIFKEINI